MTASIDIDASELTRLAGNLGGANVGNVVRDELTKAMLDSTEEVRAAVIARVRSQSGTYARSFTLRVQVTASAIVGLVTNAARSASGFVYAWTLEHGRGPVVATRAKALRFTLGGRVLYRKRVGPAAGQHPMEYGARDAEPRIQARFERAIERIAARIEAMR